MGVSLGFPAMLVALGLGPGLLLVAYPEAHLALKIAGRIEHVTVRGAFPDILVDDSLYLGRNPRFTPISASVGLLQDLPFGLVASVTAQHVERAPRAPELFSLGIHHATETFDIGNPNLRVEKAQTVEIGLRRAKGGAERFDLARLEAMSQVEQMTPTEYREAWAWVHLLLRGHPDGRALLVSYLQQLRTNPNPGPLGPRIAALYPLPKDALERHLAGLEAPRRQPSTAQR